jgi:hypothetical protein
MRTDLFQKLREVLMGDGGPFPFNALMRGLELGGFNDSFGQPAIGRQDTKIGVPQIGIVHRFKQDFGHCSSEAGCTALSLKGSGQIALIIQINQQGSEPQLISVAAKLTDQGRFTDPSFVDADE